MDELPHFCCDLSSEEFSRDCLENSTLIQSFCQSCNQLTKTDSRRGLAICTICGIAKGPSEDYEE